MTKIQQLKEQEKEIIEYQDWAERKREENKLIKLGLIDGQVEYFFDKSGDMIERFVQTVFPKLVKLSRNHPSGMDYCSGPDTFCEIKGNKAGKNFVREGNKNKIFLELTQNTNKGSKNNLMTMDLKEGITYYFLTFDTSPETFGNFWLIDWKKAKPIYAKLQATTSGGHSARGVKVEPVEVLFHGNIYDLVKEDN